MTKHVVKLSLLITLVVSMRCDEKVAGPAAIEPKEWITDYSLITEIVSKVDSTRIWENLVDITSLGSRSNQGETIDEVRRWLIMRAGSGGQSSDVQRYLYYDFDIYFISRETGFLYWEEVLGAHTVDGGETWQRFRIPFFDDAFFFNDKKGFMTLRRGYVKHTSDGGLTWETRINGTGGDEIYFLDEMNGYLSDLGEVYKTSDGGYNWQRLTDFDVGEYAYFLNDSIMWIEADNILYKTTNAWSDWEEIDMGSAYYSYISFIDENNGFIFSSDRGWLKSHDGGYHWIPCEISTPFLVPPDHVYSVMDRQLYKSVNAGSSFVEVNTLETAPQDWFFVDSLTGWLVNRVGFNYNVLKTEDGGLSWIDKSQTLPENITWENIIIEIPGKLYPDQQVLLIAHFDAIGGQGADDNATGMAALLEILAAFESYHFANTVKIIFMSGEEKGMIGSGYYADQAKSSNDNIVGLINFDAIGYWDNEHPRDLNIIHNDKSEHLADSLINVINTYTNTVVTKGNSYGPQSDHERFWGTWPSVWFCEAGSRAEMSPFTNSRGDSLNTLNQSFLFENIKASVAAAAAIAQPVRE